MKLSLNLIFQLLATIVQFGNQVFDIAPEGWKPKIALVVGLAQLIIGWRAQFYNPDGTPATVAYRKPSAGEKHIKQFMVLFLACLLPMIPLSGCKKKGVVVAPTPVAITDQNLHTIATKIDQASIVLDQFFIVRDGLVSDGFLSSEASEKLSAVVTKVIGLTENLRAGTAAVSSFESGQTQLSELYSALISEAGSMAVNLGLSEEATARLVPLLQVAVNALEALKPLFGFGGGREAVRSASIPIGTITSLAAVALTISTYEKGRAGLSTSGILDRARDTLARAKTRS